MYFLTIVLPTFHPFYPHKIFDFPFCTDNITYDGISANTVGSEIRYSKLEGTAAYDTPAGHPYEAIPTPANGYDMLHCPVYEHIGHRSTPQYATLQHLVIEAHVLNLRIYLAFFCHSIGYNSSLCYTGTYNGLL